MLCESDYSSTQHAFQVPLDNDCFQSLIASSSIQDRARLLAATDSVGCSSAWLKAIPHPSLGITMPVAEFVAAVRIWLGVPLFPTVQLCTQLILMVTIFLAVLMALYVYVCMMLWLLSCFTPCSWTILVFCVNRESLGIINLNLVIFTILTSVKAVRLSLMFLFETHSLLQLFLRRQFLLGLQLLLGRLSRINIIRIMLLLLEDCLSYDCEDIWSVEYFCS